MKSTILRIMGTAAICLLLTGAFSCKSKKQATDTSEADRQRMEQMEREKQAREEEEARRRAEEERLAREREAAANAPSAKLKDFFSSIANASSESSADKTINEALNMFSSKDVPVLIIIYENKAENVTDYDEPTTIGKYLQYLKVVKRKPDAVHEIKFDSNGKINELILKKAN